MRKTLTILFAMAMSTFVSMSAADIVTPSPRPLQVDSKDVVLTYHADQGNKALMGQRPTQPIYAHIGLITDKSTSDTDWKYAPTWLDNDEKYELEYESTDEWTLEIGDIRTYFGIDASVKVKKIALVFRDATGTKQGKTEAGGDIYVEVYEAGAQMDFSHDASQTYLLGTTTVNFTVSTTIAGNLSLDVNGTVFKSASNATSLTGAYTFSSPGSYKVTAKAVCGAETLTKSVEFVYPTAAVAKNYPGGVPKMGAVKNSDGSVNFCLAAPQKSTVTIVGAWDDYQILAKNQMYYQDYNGNRYFWITVQGLDNSTYYPYYYLVDGTKAVGDPYTHLVLDPYNDQWLKSTVFPDRPKYPTSRVTNNAVLAVYKGDIDEYNWRVKNFQIPDPKSLVIYELLLRDFTGTEGRANANGTLAMAIEKIPYLKSLGVNAIELMPIMEFNGNNSWGYNTNFYMAVDKAYGSPDEYKKFIDLCHQNGMAVILDIVFNQSDGLHPWYQLYPIESNPFYNKNAPHAYSVLNDWKQDHPLVMQQWKDAITYWMTAYKVDGFRFDLVKGLGDNNSYGGDTEKYNSSRVRRMTELHNAIKAVNPNGIHINEHLAGSKEENEMAADGQLNWHQLSWNSCQYAMGWPEENNGTKLNGFLSTDTGRTWGSTIAYAESHDEERMGYKQIQYGHTSVKTDLTARCHRLGSMAAIMLLTPGPKMIWQFGELGNEETTKTSDGGNDTSPKKVYWNYLNDPDRAGLLANYTALCHLRMDNPTLFTQDATFQRPSWSTDMTTPRTLRLCDGTREVVAFINPSPTNSLTITVSAQMLSASNSQLITASKGFNPQITGNGTTVSVTVPANCFAVYATRNVTGQETVDADVVNSSARVYVADGAIVVEGDFSGASVYSTSGVCVGAATPANASVAVAPGLYIVNVDGQSTKVVVR